MDATLKSILLVCCAMVLFACSDTISKVLAREIPAIEVAWLRWLGFVTYLLPNIIVSRGATLVSKAPLGQVIRACGLLGSSVFFIFALQRLPLATATTIGFVSPLIVTILSIPLLGEQVRARRWAAVFVGLVGVLVVVRPGSASFDMGMIFPVLSALTWAIGVVFTRRSGGADKPVTSMAYTAIVGFLILSVMVPGEWIMPRQDQLYLAAIMAAFAAGGQFLIAMAYGRAPASLLAPFSYTQLVWSSSLGFLVFGNVPDFWTGIGAAIIISSGLYTAHRERVRRGEA